MNAQHIDLATDPRAADLRVRLALLATAADECLNWPRWADVLQSAYARHSDLTEQASDDQRRLAWASFQQLCQSIQHDGQREPAEGLLVDGQLFLRDGHHRAAIALALSRPFAVRLQAPRQAT